MQHSTPQHRKHTHSNRKFYCGLACLLLLMPFVIGGFASTGKQDVASMGLEAEAVKVGRFYKSVPASGDIRTFNPAIVFSDCRAYERRIIELVPEGTRVEPGDVVCVLDSSELRDRLNQQQIQLIRAKAGLAGAEIRKSMQELINARVMSANVSRATLASGRLHAFRDAESKNTVEQLRNDVRLKKDGLLMAQDTLSRTQESAAMGLSNPAELTVANAAHQNANAAVDLALGQLSLAQKFTQPRTMLAMRSEVDASTQELHRTELQNTLNLTMAQLSTLEMERWVAGVQNYVDYLTTAIDACTMLAPKAGEVIYCHKRDEGKYIEVGSKVHYMQNLLRISNRSRIIIAGKVSDRQVYELNAGMLAEITVQSNPDEKISGRLTWVASIPSAAVWYQPYDLHHDIEIELDQNPNVLASLALGATASIEIIVDDRSDVLQIPVRGIFNHHGEYNVIVQNSTGLYRRVIQLGASNEKWVEVTRGLDLEDVVVFGDQHRMQRLANSLSL